MRDGARMTNAIAGEGLRKRFGEAEALAGVTYEPVAWELHP